MNNIYEVLQASKKVVDAMQNEYLSDPHKELIRTIEKYNKFIISIEKESPQRNLISGLSRRYIEAGRDYRNPILDTMYDIEKYMYRETP